MARRLPQTLKEFIGSKEWDAALRLLRKKKQEITLATSEVIASQAGHVVLDHEGFKLWSGVVGEAAVYTQQKPTVKTLTTAEEVEEEIRNCNDGAPLSESELILTIFEHLREK